MKLTTISQFRSNAQPKEVTLFFINSAKYEVTAISQSRSYAQHKEVTLFFINNVKYEADCYQPIQI